jgi:hypothetical protein
VNFNQLEFKGMPVGKSLKRIIRRSDYPKLVAAARLGCDVIQAIGIKDRKISAYACLETARTLLGIRFSAKDRILIASLADIPIENFQLPSEFKPTAKNSFLYELNFRKIAITHLQKIIEVLLFDETLNTPRV